MTSPRVTEMPRRLEPVSRDTFLAHAQARSAGGVVDLRPQAATDSRWRQDQPRAA